MEGTPEPEAAVCTYVPDGAPCPRHQLPTRLLYLAGGIYVSQCRGCIEDFFAWRLAQLRIRSAAIVTRPVPAPRPPMTQTPGEQAIATERRAAESFVLELFA